MHRIVVKTHQPYSLQFTDMLKEKLPRLCAVTFETDAFPLFSRDFDTVLHIGLKRLDKPLVDIIVSVELQDAASLLPSDSEDAELIRDLVVILLDTNCYYLDDVGPRVGVSLVYNGEEHEWVEGTIADITRQSRREVMGLLP